MTFNISGINNSPKSSWVTLTGIGAVQPVAVNPTNTEYAKITGSEMPYELTYDVAELNGTLFRPVRILTHNVEHNVFNFINFYISNENEVSKAGDKVNSIDPKGVMTYKPIDGDVDYAWFDSKESIPLKRGEQTLHTFLQTLLKYDQKAENANWRLDLAQNGITPERLYAGDMSGLQALIDYSNKLPVGDSGHNYGHKVGVLFEIKKTARIDKETGNEVPGEYNFNQVINNRHFFYASEIGGIPNSAYKRLRSIRDKQETAGYQLTKNLWTFKLQQFNESDCEGQEPTDSVENTSNQANPMKWV